MIRANKRTRYSEEQARQDCPVDVLHQQFFLAGGWRELSGSTSLDLAAWEP